MTAPVFDTRGGAPDHCGTQVALERPREMFGSSREMFGTPREAFDIRRDMTAPAGHLAAPMTNLREGAR